MGEQSQFQFYVELPYNQVMGDKVGGQKEIRCNNKEYKIPDGTKTVFRLCQDTPLIPCSGDNSGGRQEGLCLWLYVRK